MFSLDSRGTEGLWGSLSSFAFVASDVDCLSADRSHVHGHVGELLVNIVHTLVVDHTIRFNDVLEK